MFCSVLQCIAECFVEYTACHDGVVQCGAVCCGVLQCVAVYCSMLQCMEVYCIVLQCIAVYGRVFCGIHCKP